MEPDRRRDARHKVKDHSLFVFNHFSTRVGDVMDISENGISFEFQHEVDTEFSPEVIDLFCVKNGYFYVSGIRCKIVYTHHNEPKDGDKKGYSQCRCGARFNALTDGQRAKLEDIFESGVI